MSTIAPQPQKKSFLQKARDTTSNAFKPIFTFIKNNPGKSMFIGGLATAAMSMFAPVNVVRLGAAAMGAGTMKLWSGNAQKTEEFDGLQEKYGKLKTKNFLQGKNVLIAETRNNTLTKKSPKALVELMDKLRAEPPKDLFKNDDTALKVLTNTADKICIGMFKSEKAIGSSIIDNATNSGITDENVKDIITLTNMAAESVIRISKEADGQKYLDENPDIMENIKATDEKIKAFYAPKEGDSNEVKESKKKSLDTYNKQSETRHDKAKADYDKMPDDTEDNKSLKAGFKKIYEQMTRLDLDKEYPKNDDGDTAGIGNPTAVDKNKKGEGTFYSTGPNPP